MFILAAGVDYFLIWGKLTLYGYLIVTEFPAYAAIKFNEFPLYVQ